MEAATPPYFVAIGASGSEGLDDIGVLLHLLWQPFPAVLMVVLHRPSDKVSHLAEILARSCTMPVVIAAEAERMVAGTCYIGEPDQHLTLVAHSLARLMPEVQRRVHDRSIDILFYSLAAYAGPRAVGVILSGLLDDGARGIAAIHAAKGITMVLNPGEKRHGMQRAAIDYDGPISLIGTATEIADAVREIVTR